ncbi:hypothetical protein [Flavonifractor sp. An92]|uniref:hypothetical protein n=1 Tax=Flavonifractor sp. An92 TaxID=1965666 RepID=UPI001179FB55|nr:hypothetical protein [Flavonifractor sp. An92]
MAAILAGCMSIGLMTPALAVEGEGTDPTTTPEVTTSVAPTDEVDSSFSVDPTAEPTEEPAETPTTEPTETPAETPSSEPTETPAETPSSEPTETPAETPSSEPTETPAETPTTEPTESPEITDIPEETIPGGGDPGFTMPDYANMSVEELYAAVKDMSTEDRAIVYSLLTEEQIAALEAYEQQAQVTPPAAVDYESMSNEELYAYGMENLSVEERIALLDQLSEERRADFLAYVEEYEASLIPEAPEQVESDYSGAPDEIDVGPIVHYDTPLRAAATQNAPMALMAMNSPSLYDTGDGADENPDGSITYDDNVTVNKTIRDTGEDVNGKDIYKLDLSAEAVSNVVEGYSAVDIVLMLDLSDYMEPMTVTQYTYKVLADSYNFKEFYDNRSQFYYKVSDDKYVPVTVTKEEGFFSTTYYIYANGKYIEEGTRRNNVTRSNYYTRTVSGYDTVDNLASLKVAVTQFINTVNTKSPDSRIAIVTYANSAYVKTGQERAQDEALVTVGENYDALIGIVNNLEVLGGDSNSDLAMADAVKIFQDVPHNSEEYSRDRVALLFSAGTAGNGYFRDSTGYNPVYAWNGTGNKVAQGSMHLATILKEEKTQYATIDLTQGFYEGNTITQSMFDSYGVSKAGCGATVYTVGLNLANTADIMTTNIYGTEGARINEYMYRISQHRPDGDHYNYDQMDSTWQTLYHSVPDYGSKYNGNNGYGFYPDELTRDQIPDGYFLTATSENIGRLTDIFELIGQQVGEGAKVSVVDYIDPAFTLVDQNGNPLNVGDQVKDGEYTGIVQKDENGYCINWSDVTLDPGNEIVGGEPVNPKKFNASIYVVSNDSSFGGNQVPTNIGNLSGVSTGTELYKFPEPTVNLPINYQVNGTVETIPVGTSVDYDDLITYADRFTPNGTNNAHVTITYTLKQNGAEIGTYTILAGQTEGSWSWSDSGKTNTGTLITCQDYTLECTVSPVKTTGADSLGNEAVSAIDRSATPKIHVLVPTITWKDTTVDAGKTPNYGVDNYGGITWADAHGDDIDTTVATDWDVSYTYSPVAGVINAETEVNVTVKVNGTDITDHVLFERTCDSDRSHSNHHSGSDSTKCEFVIHLNNIELSITKTVNEQPEQSFIFTVIGPSGTMTIAMGASEFTKEGDKWTCTKTITGLKSGTYTVTEDTKWSWMYNVVDGTATKDATQGDDGKLSVTFDNTRNGNNWLGGSDSVENVFATTDGASAAALRAANPAALPNPLPSTPKDNENGDEKNKDQNTEPDPSEPMETQEGGVSNV